MAPQTVSTADQFETNNAEVKKLKMLCTPGNKNGEGVFDTTTPEGMFIYRISSSFAELERDLTRERLREAIEARRVFASPSVV